MEEIWKPIPGYENLYDASSLGRIRSTPGKTTSSRRFARRVWKSRIMKTKFEHTRRQDFRVSLWKDGQVKDHLVARLVASAWHGVPAPGMTVNHINGNFQDNRPENLEWISLRENIQHGFRTGLYASSMKPVILISQSGERTEYESMASAGRAIGRDSQYISNRLGKGYTIACSATGEKFTIVRKYHG